MSVRSVLVRAPNWIGDQVLAFPFFFYLRHAYPKAKIVSVCAPWVKDIQFKGLVDEVQVLQRAPGEGLWSKFKAIDETALKLKGSGPYDLGLSLPNSFSAAWFLYRAGAERRRGYSVDARGLLLNDRVKWNPDPAIHRAQAYLNLLPKDRVEDPRLEGFWTTRPAPVVESAEVPEEPAPGVLDAFDAQSFWAATDTLEPPSRPYFVVAPGSTAESRRWPPEYFAKLIDLIASETGFQAVLIGGPSEVGAGTVIRHAAESEVVDLIGQSRVSGLWKVLKGAKVTITNESGLAHVAALCGSDVQIVCGAANPNRTAPTGPGRVKVTINPVECWPCERNTCHLPGGERFKCLMGIAPQAVWEEMKRAFRF